MEVIVAGDVEVRPAEHVALVRGRALRDNDRSVDVYAHRLRFKLAAAVPGWDSIRTHLGLGHRLAPELSQPVHKTVAQTQQAVAET